MKIGKEFEYVPAVKNGRGWLGLEKGKFGKVRFEKRFGKLEVWIKSGNTWRRSLFPVEDYARANEAARAANKIGEQAGADFGSLRKEEEAALKLWREYVLSETMKGTPPRKLDEVMRELIERERRKDETQPFNKAAFRFLEWKDAHGGISLAWRNRVAARVKALAAYFGETPMAEITETVVVDALPKITRARDKSAPPSPKTLKHWTEILREIFKWYYARENASRRAADKLTNPLEILSAPKSAPAREAEILTARKARAILDDLWEHAPEAVPAAAVQLFCGVREAEAMRLRWRDVKAGKVFLSKEITKTKKARSVPVSENLSSWLEAFKARFGVPADEALLFPRSDIPPAKLAGMPAEARERAETEAFTNRTQAFVYRLRRAAKRLGFPVPANAFRHSAVSYLAEIHGHSRAADFCGHSVDVQGIHYRANVSAQEARDYFGIMPHSGDGKTIAFSRERAPRGNVPNPPSVAAAR